MPLDNWTEVLRCMHCAQTGVANLSQDANGIIVIHSLPAGFRAVTSEYGDTFFCDACDRPATTRLK